MNPLGSLVRRSTSFAPLIAAAGASRHHLLSVGSLHSINTPFLSSTQQRRRMATPAAAAAVVGNREQRTAATSGVWRNHVKVPDTPKGFTLRTTYPTNPLGAEVMLEQWEAGKY